MTKRRAIGKGLAHLGALLALVGCSPPALLNGLNNLTPGDGNARLVASGVTYGSDPARSSTSGPRAAGPRRRCRWSSSSTAAPG